MRRILIARWMEWSALPSCEVGHTPGKDLEHSRHIVDHLRWVGLRESPQHWRRQVNRHLCSATEVRRWLKAKSSSVQPKLLPWPGDEGYQRYLHTIELFLVEKCSKLQDAGYLKYFQNHFNIFHFHPSHSQIDLEIKQTSVNDDNVLLCICF